MYNALITDLDGTAIEISSNGSGINDDTKHSIQSAIDQGKKLTCATGREWELTRDVVKKLGFTSPCIIEGGTRIIDPVTEATIWEKSFKDNVSANIFSIFKSASKSGMIMHSSNTDRQLIQDVQSVPGSLRFLYLLGVKEDVAIRISNQINSRDDAIAHFTPSWEGEGLVDIHVTDPEATKEHAIQVWQRMEGVTKEETIGIGDSGNDIPIFHASGYKVAVGNATSALKEYADYIGPNFNDNALKYVIDNRLLDERSF